MNTNDRIRTKGKVITVRTEFGVTVKITKKQAYQLLYRLNQRSIEPVVEFVTIHNDKELVIIHA